MKFLSLLSSSPARAGRAAARRLSTFALAGVLLGALALGGRSARADVITINGNTADATPEGPVANQDGSTDASGVTVIAPTAGSVVTGIQSRTQGRNAVFVFQLPVLSNQTLTSANLTLKASGAGASGGATVNIDLYGLTFRSTPTVLASDYYFGTNDTTDATLLQDNYVGITNGTRYNFALNSSPTLSASGTTNLTSYLNTQYGNGAAGNYVFIRLSPDTVGASNTLATFSYNSADSGTFPQLTLNTSVAPVPEPSTWAMMALGVGALGLIARRKREGEGEREGDAA